MNRPAACRPQLASLFDVCSHVGNCRHAGSVVRHRARLLPRRLGCLRGTVERHELSITCGYHRLFSHATYQAHPVVKAIFLLFGAMLCRIVA